MRVKEIVEITPKVTDILLLFKWTRFTWDLELYKGNLKSYNWPSLMVLQNG